MRDGADDVDQPRRSLISPLSIRLGCGGGARLPAVILDAFPTLRHRWGAGTARPDASPTLAALQMTLSRRKCAAWSGSPFRPGGSQYASGDVMDLPEAHEMGNWHKAA